MWLALTLSSFLAFLVCMASLTRRGFSADGAFQRGGVAWIVAAVAAALLWVFSLSELPPPYPVENTRRYEAPNFPLPPVKP
jgi:hypothetical protein